MGNTNDKPLKVELTVINTIITLSEDQQKQIEELYVQLETFPNRKVLVEMWLTRGVNDAKLHLLKVPIGYK